MGIPVQSIVDRVTDLLTDKDRGDDEARWPDAELLRWINDSRAAIITRRPVACSKLATVTLVAGAQQDIPADATQLLDVICNMGSDGLTPGRSIRRADRQDMDDADPAWMSATTSSSISQFMYDDRVPRVFYVSPPAAAATKIRIAAPYMPAEIDDLADTLDMQPEYIEAVANYVAYRAKSKDSEFANAAEAAAFYAAFSDSLGTTQQGQAANSPNQPGNSV